MEEKEPGKNQTSQDAPLENTEEVQDNDLDQARGGLARQPATDQTLRR